VLLQGNPVAARRGGGKQQKYELLRYNRTCHITLTEKNLDGDSSKADRRRNVSLM